MRPHPVLRGSSAVPIGDGSGLLAGLTSRSSSGTPSALAGQPFEILGGQAVADDVALVETLDRLPDRLDDLRAFPDPLPGTHRLRCRPVEPAMLQDQLAHGALDEGPVLDRQTRDGALRDGREPVAVRLLYLTLCQNGFPRLVRLLHVGTM